jgi:molybdopterin-containing oxidoreductase family membrane subunit
MVDLGRPDRAWHMVPGLGKFNWPVSMLTWDVIVLNGYLLLNLHIVGYLMYMRFLGRAPNPRWYIPFVFLSILWAVSIHTVTAFLYCGLGGRPFWNTALLAPRFLATAFVAGPSFIILTLQVIRRTTNFHVGDRPVHTLIQIIRVAMAVNLVMLASELFTVFYTGSGHAASARYLYFGDHGHNGLVPWIWSATVLNLFGFACFLCPTVFRNAWVLDLGCVCCFLGIWIEKGMGLIVPGFIPSTLHELVEYAPTLTEWKITAGVWAFGLLVFTAGLKVAIAVFTNQMTLAREART